MIIDYSLGGSCDSNCKKIIDQYLNENKPTTVCHDSIKGIWTKLTKTNIVNNF